MKKSIVWFKTDLRLHDNETLVNAIIHSDEVLPVYFWDESHFKKTAFGFDKTGNFRTQFLLESITDLDKQLRTYRMYLPLSEKKQSKNLMFVQFSKHPKAFNLQQLNR